MKYAKQAIGVFSTLYDFLFQFEPRDFHLNDK